MPKKLFGFLYIVDNVEEPTVKINEKDEVEELRKELAELRKEMKSLKSHGEENRLTGTSTKC